MAARKERFNASHTDAIWTSWLTVSILDNQGVIELPHEPSGLTKATWTDADFSVMGWHDCRVHAISVGEYEDDTRVPARLLLDLDYIIRWSSPAMSSAFECRRNMCATNFSRKPNEAGSASRSSRSRDCPPG